MQAFGSTEVSIEAHGVSIVSGNVALACTQLVAKKKGALIGDLVKVPPKQTDSL